MLDPVSEIKARLPIEQLVGSYCQLQKKGRNFVCLCPFHNDTRPSFLVSPDKGIAYCFACRNGGDIFSFYQKVEGVDFPQAIRDLAERVGVTIEDKVVPVARKDEKDRLRDCLEKALQFYRSQFSQSQKAVQYVQNRGVPADVLDRFRLGLAPDSFSATYDYLLKAGFSRTEIVSSGLAIQRDLGEGKMYDRFRNRIMFPISDHQGRLVGFGGRTLGEDDAKYINSSEGPLYHKASVLFGLSEAKEAMRETNAVIVVEGYFDVLACHKVGMKHVVAVSGTALTPQHVTLLKRYAETAILCLDQDRAGKDAAERAYHMCSEEGLHVHAVRLPGKDPAEIAEKEPGLLANILGTGGVPYIDVILEDVRSAPPSSATEKREVRDHLLTLLMSLPSAVDREKYLQSLESLLGMTLASAYAEMSRNPRKQTVPKAPEQEVHTQETSSPFSRLEIALGLFLLYPQWKSALDLLIEPEEGFSHALYEALKIMPEAPEVIIGTLQLSEEWQERASILQLYCEHHGFKDWSENLTLKEIRKHCSRANYDVLKVKQKEITQRMIKAKLAGEVEEEAMLLNQYQQLLKLQKLAVVANEE